MDKEELEQITTEVLDGFKAFSVLEEEEQHFVRATVQLGVLAGIKWSREQLVRDPQPTSDSKLLPDPYDGKIILLDEFEETTRRG